jgi:hypothetical protein
MKNTICSHQAQFNYCRGKVHGVCGRSELIINDFQGFVFSPSPNYGVDEVLPIGAIKPLGPYNAIIPRKDPFYAQFTFQF